MQDVSRSCVSPVTAVDAAKCPSTRTATGFFVSNGIISITLESIRADHGDKPGPLSRVVVGRLTMPAAGAQGLAIGLFDFLEKQGFKYEKPPG